MHQNKSSYMQYGIDIGGTKMELGIFDDNQNLLSSQRIQTPTDDYSKFLQAVIFLVEQADQNTLGESTVGIGLPCVIDSNNFAVSSNIQCINGKNVHADIREKLKRCVRFGNDSETFAIAESVCGAGKNHSKVLSVIIGTGVNSTLCVQGKLFTSHNKIAGEWGHVLLSALHQQRYGLPLLECGCGSLGCVEPYVSGKGLEWLYTHMGGDKISAQTLVTKMRHGDHLAVKTFNCYLDLLAHSLAQLVIYYDPDVIVVGGGISNISEIYMYLPDLMSDYLFKGVLLPKIVGTKFSNHSALLGAAIIGAEGSELVTQLD
jgi:N-acetylglucosamine kinase